jgi:nucleoid DNA-binding protein
VGKINSVLTGQYKVAIQGFGTFEPRVKKSIKVRNPITKNVHTKSAYIFCHFRASDQLRKRLENSGNFILP